MSLDVAERIRSLREKRGLSQRGLAEAAGVSPAALSQIESGQTSPSVATLEKLADGLGVAVAAFFLGREEAAGVEGFSLDERPHVPLRGGCCLIPLASQWYAVPFEPMLVQLSPGAELGERPFGSGGAVEYVWVRRGSAMLDYEGKRLHFFETQSVYYDPRRAHNWRNEGTAPCELLMVRSR